MGFGFSLYENVKGFTGSGLQNRIASNMIRVPKHCATESPSQINSTTLLLLFEKKVLSSPLPPKIQVTKRIVVVHLRFAFQRVMLISI